MCRGLSPAALTEIKRISYRKRFPRGATVMHEGEPAEWCAVISSGVAKLVSTTIDGRQQIVGMQFASEFIGQPFAGSPRLQTEAATDLELCCFSRAQFEQLIDRHPGCMHAHLQDTTESLEAARRWMVVLGRKTATERVASFLLHVAERSNIFEPQPTLRSQSTRQFKLPLSRSEIGLFLGLRLETVSRQFKALKDARVVATIGSRDIRILDRARLEQLAESMSD